MSVPKGSKGYLNVSDDEIGRQRYRNSRNGERGNNPYKSVDMG